MLQHTFSKSPTQLSASPVAARNLPFNIITNLEFNFIPIGDPMLIKNIKAFRKYLKESTDNHNKDENFIGYSYPEGTDDETTQQRGFFAVYHSQSPRINERLATVLNMAQDSQAIYEFVQNAVDCDSTAFFMNYSDEYFIAINNGESFDLSGVRAILNFAQSTKNRTADDNIGKFGVGFKLIHRMVGIGNGMNELTQNYTGPILFSWSKREQLEQLLKAENSADLQCDSGTDWNAKTSPWLFKILLTCVPVLPSTLEGKLFDTKHNVREDLFTAEEYAGFHKFLKAYWKSNADKFAKENLDRGSLFFLKLGQNKRQRLDEDFDYFRKGIQYSLSFIRNLMKRQGLSRIYFKEQEPLVSGQADIMLEPPFVLKPGDAEFENIRKDLDDYDKDRNISFVFGYQEFGKTENYGGLKNAPNFYKFFPMGKEDCGLNFILHCNAFQIDTSRREFSQGDVLNRFLLTYFVRQLCKTLDEHRIVNPERYRQIFLAILFSDNPSRGNNAVDRKWLSDALYVPLLQYISSNCPVEELNRNVPAQEVIARKTSIAISPAELGIENKNWLYWDMKDEEYKDILPHLPKLQIQSWGVVELIAHSAPGLFKEWYASIDEIQKQFLQDELAPVLENQMHNDEFWKQIVTVPSLVHFVNLHGGKNAKTKFIQHTSSLVLESFKTYSRDDYEYQLLKMAKEAELPSPAMESFRSKVSIRDEEANLYKLADVSESDKIRFAKAEHALQVSDVLPGNREKSGLIGKIIKNLEEQELPVSKFLGIGHSKPAAKVFAQLKAASTELENPYQFIFLDYYSDELNEDLFPQFGRKNMRLSVLAGLYIRKKLPVSAFAAKYLIKEAPKRIISEAYALPEEKLTEVPPQWFAEPEAEREEKLQFFEDKLGINMESGAVVKIRKAFVLNEPLAHDDILEAAARQKKHFVNLLRYLQKNEIKINSNLHKENLKVIIENCFKLDLLAEAPLVYAGEISGDDIVSYFVGDATADYLIYDREASNFNSFGISLREFVTTTGGESCLLDAALYPVAMIAALGKKKVQLVALPDKAKINKEYWDGDEDFFLSWMDSTGIQMRFLSDEIPYQVLFNGQPLKALRNETYCYDEVENRHYLTIPSVMDPIEQANKIYELIRSLPENVISIQHKETLKKKFEKWQANEEENVSDISKKKAKQETPYTFEWLKHVFDWEYHSIVRKKKAHTLTFDRIERYKDKIVLSECSEETIPPRIEFIAEPLIVKLKYKRTRKWFTCRIAVYKEFEIHLEILEQAHKTLFCSIPDLREYRAMLELPVGDMLMDNLKANLFDAKRVIPREGNMKTFFVSQIEQKKMSFLFGPPGTGKTTRLAVDIMMTICAGQSKGISPRLLVLTPTNKAADVVLERMISLMENPAQLQQVASFNYKEDQVRTLLEWSATVIETQAYKNMLIRLGNSASETLITHGLVWDKETEKTLAESFVVCATIHRLGYDTLAGISLQSPAHEFTHLIVDEASMISLPHIVFALAQFSNLQMLEMKAGFKNPILISGDPFQLKPVGQTPNYVDEKNGYRGWSTENVYSLFELDNFEAETSGVGNYAVDKLMKQFRSIPAIGNLFSGYKYKGLLKHYAQSNDTGINLGGKPLNPVVPVTFPTIEKTQDGDEAFLIHTYGDFSAYQAYSIVLACELAYKLKAENPAKSVGIISPYGTQARLLYEISVLFNDHFPDAPFSASTVHRYQGDENHIIILLMLGTSNSPFEFSHFNNSNLLNVGISRAKECLVLLYPEELVPTTEIKKNILSLVPVEEVLSHTEIEKRIFNHDDAEHEGTSPYLRNKIVMKDFHSFNVADVDLLNRAGKEYLFFAGNKNVNLILNLGERGSFGLKIRSNLASDISAIHFLTNVSSLNPILIILYLPIVRSMRLIF